MSKLLNKPFKAFTIYALVILVCSIPVYFYVVDSIWLEELDEHNEIIKTRIKNGLSKIDLQGEELKKNLVAWNNIQPGTKLTPSTVSEIRPDSFYTTIRQRKFESDVDRFRGLSAFITVNNTPYHLIIETNVEEVDETLLSIAFVTFLFFCLLVIGFVLLNKRIARKIWLPFQNTLGKLKDFDLNTHKDLQFENSDIEEFQELNSELNKLIEKNILAFSQQKTFIENASHELQTPLAILKTKFDLLLQSKNLTNEQSDIIASINSSLSRISRVNKNLLILSKIENSQFGVSETVDIASTLNESIELLSDYTATKSIIVERLTKDTFSISCNKTLLEILLNNLLVNAIQHNSAGSKITVELSNGEIKFSNSGNEGLNKEHLFKRFGNTAVNKPGTGLGLSIVKEVCNRYNWGLSYNFESKQHIFTVKFQ